MWTLQGALIAIDVEEIKMRALLLLFTAVAILLLLTPAFADTCPQSCEYTGAITAQLTGTVYVSFESYDANFYDWVKIKDLTLGTESPWGLLNQDCGQDPPVNCDTLQLPVNSGDSIVLALCAVPDFAPDHTCASPQAQIYYTDQSMNSDGGYHAISPSAGSPACGSNCLTAGGSIWFEDLNKQWWGGTEPDYNDEVVQWTGLTIQLISPPGVATPEPASCLLLGGGLIAAYLKRRL